MRKLILSVALGSLMLLPSAAFAKAKGRSAHKRHHARSAKHKAKSSKRAKHADNDKQLMTPKWT
jgi:Ni/Co efflux regulator RcnB